MRSIYTRTFSCLIVLTLFLTPASANYSTLAPILSVDGDIIEKALNPIDYEPAAEPKTKLVLESEADIINSLSNKYLAEHPHQAVRTMALTLRDSFAYMVNVHIPLSVASIKNTMERDKARDMYMSDMKESIRPMIKALYVIAEKQIAGDIRPDAVSLRLSDKKKTKISINTDLLGGRKAKVAYLPMKGDPWQVGHVWMLMDMLARGCDKLLIMLDNSAPLEKPGLSSLPLREAFGKKIFEMMGEFIEYMEFQKEDPTLYTADGETICNKILEVNSEVLGDLEFYYLAGADHLNWIEVQETPYPQNKRERVEVSTKDEVFEHFKGVIKQRKPGEPKIFHGNYQFILNDNGDERELRLDVPGILWLSMEQLKKDHKEIKDFELHIMFSHRDADKLKKEQKDEVDNALRELDNDAYKIIAHIRHQPMDTSSSAVRKRGEYHTMLWVTMREIMAMKTYLFADANTTNVQESLAEYILIKLCPVVMSGENEFNSALAELAPAIANLVGPGINRLDGTLVKWQRSYEEYGRDLTNQIGASKAAPLLPADNDEFLRDRMDIIRELLFEQARNIVDGSNIQNVLHVSAEVMKQLTGGRLKVELTSIGSDEISASN